MNSLEHGQQIIHETVKTLDEKPGVYQMLNVKGEYLYIGKAKNLKKRVASYAHITKLPNRLRRMVSELSKIKIVITHSEVEALLLESNLIKKQTPPYNILLKDDKSFPYILINPKHPFPRIEKYRGVKESKGYYFGPFASASAIEEALIILQKVFLLRSCRDSYFNNRHRPCLQYHIKRCSAPCTHKISEENYALLVKQAIDYLEGKTDQVQNFLAEKMGEASDKMAFEEACHYRDRIRLLSHLLAHQRINVSHIIDTDVIAIIEEGGQTCVQIFFFRKGQNRGNESFFLTHTQDSSLDERLSAFLTQFYTRHDPAPLIILNKEPGDFSLIQQSISHHYGKKITWEVNPIGLKQELLQHALSNAKDAIQRKFSESAMIGQLMDELIQLFGLSKRPNRIEVYDNSHLQGTHPYGVMIVADEKGFNKKAYRKFSISCESQDDYAMMRDVLRRRLAHTGEETWVLPDLMLIDGGQGHLNTVREVIDELGIQGITLVAIAKGPQRNAGREQFFMGNRAPFSLPLKSPLLHYLQRLRDEAHRFAIGTHKASRQKNLIKSQLDAIPGIGMTRKKALLQHFGSAKRVSQATLKELRAVKGIHISMAQTIYHYFHEI